MTSTYDLVVLAGGTARRLGGRDKVTLPLDGTSSVERLLAQTADAGRVIGVGEVRETSRPIFWCREEPPGSGPLAAVAAALPHASGDIVLVAAGDMPFLGEAKQALLDALAGAELADAATLCDGAGVRQPLAAAYRRDALMRRIRDLDEVADRPARLLLDGLNVVDVPADRSADDIDTWDDVYRIEEELRRAR